MMVVGQLSPPVFVIGLDGRSIFGKRQLNPDITIEVAVPDMMDDLPNETVE